MSRPQLFGKMPTIKSGPNKGRLDRPAAADAWGLCPEALSKAYNNWIQTFRLDGTNLTLEQYLLKLREAGITPADVGNGRERWHLARYNDEGPYTNESCRFVPAPVNYGEQKKTSPYFLAVAKHGEAQAREMMRENGKKAHER